MRRRYIVCFLGLLIGVLACGDELHDQQKVLESQFLNQVVIIRNFYTDDKLVFNPKGEVIKGGKSDCWNAAQMEIKKVSLKPDLLTFEGNRVIGSYDRQAKKLIENYREPEKVKIELQLDSGHRGNNDIVNLMTKVFLTRNDNLENLIPTVQPGCDKPFSAPSGATVARVGPGIQPPKAIFAPDPQYSEQARAARWQGATTLWAVIGTDGKAHNIKVVRATGYGLDQAAVEAVSKWKFQPAVKDGQPIAVQINIEVNFRLH